MKTLLATALLLLSQSVIAQEKTIRFLHINDLHAHLTPHADRVTDENGVISIEERGGFARLATVLKQQRAENPNTITMNIGDTFHGGAEALFSMGNAIVEPVNALGIDIGVAGNWDFAYSPGVTRMRFGPVDLFGILPNSEAFKIGFPGNYLDDPFPILRPNYTSLGANVTDIAVPVWNFMPATKTIVVDGIRVGFIGLTSDIVEDMHIFMAVGFAFTKGEDNYRQLINQHANQLRKDGADIVVVMSELGIHKDNRLAQIIEPGSVDVIFSAHTHESTHQPLDSASGALVVEAGNDGWLGQMDITIDNGVITDRSWNLLAIDDSVAADADMQALVDAARAPYLADDIKMIAPPFMMQHIDQPIDTIIGHTDTTIDRKDALQSTFNAGWTDMIRQLTNTDVAISPGFRMDTTLVEPGFLYEDNTLATGEISLEDAYRLFPVVYLLAAGEIDGAGLKQVMEDQLSRTFSSDVFNHTGGWAYGISGLDLKLNLTGTDGERLIEMNYPNGDPVLDSDRLKVGGCMRTIDTPNRLCSIPGFSKVLPSASPDNKPFWTALDAFVYALGSQNLDGSRVGIEDVSSTPRWPDDSFIQPLQGVGTAVSAVGLTPLEKVKDKARNIVEKINPAIQPADSDDADDAAADAPAAAAFGLGQLLAMLGILLLRRKLRHQF